MRAMNPIATLAQSLAGNTAGASSPAANRHVLLGYQQTRDKNTSAQKRAANPVHPTHHADQLAAQLKKRLSRKALWGSTASLIPLPMIDLAVDVALLSSMLNDIHSAFGLSPAQLAALDTSKRHRTLAAIQWVGNRAIGQLLTATVVKRLISGMGVKLTAGQLSKAVPIAGQIASAALNYATLRHIIHAHIDDCVVVLKRTEQ